MRHQSRSEQKAMATRTSGKKRTTRKKASPRKTARKTARAGAQDGAQDRAHRAQDGAQDRRQEDGRQAGDRPQDDGAENLRAQDDQEGGTETRRAQGAGPQAALRRRSQRPPKLPPLSRQRAPVAPRPMAPPMAQPVRPAGPALAWHGQWRHGAAAGEPDGRRRGHAEQRPSSDDAGDSAELQPEPAALPAVLGARRRRHVGLGGRAGP